MTEQTVKNQTGWYTRPVLFVADGNRAIRFYVGMLASGRNGMRETAQERSARSIAETARLSFVSTPRAETGAFSSS